MVNTGAWSVLRGAAPLGHCAKIVLRADCLTFAIYDCTIQLVDKLSV